MNKDRYMIGTRSTKKSGDSVSISDFYNDTPGLQKDEHARAKKFMSLYSNLLHNPDYVDSSTLNRKFIPKTDTSDADLLAAGFEKSIIAVPESGQTSAITYRHPLNGLHVHKHNTVYTLHEDTHPSLQMLMSRYKLEHPDSSVYDRAKYWIISAAPESVKHVALEGIPGYINYASGIISGSDGVVPVKHGILRSVLGTALATGGLSLIHRIVSKDGTYKVLPSAAGVTGFITANKAAKALQKLLSARLGIANKGTLSSLVLLSGLPILGSIGSFMLADNITKNTQRNPKT